MERERGRVPSFRPGHDNITRVIIYIKMHVGSWRLLSKLKLVATTGANRSAFAYCDVDNVRLSGVLNAVLEADMKIKGK